MMIVRGEEVRLGELDGDHNDYCVVYIVGWKIDIVEEIR
jgi:hypothetical protein